MVEQASPDIYVTPETSNEVTQTSLSSPVKEKENSSYGGILRYDSSESANATESKEKMFPGRQESSEKLVYKNANSYIKMRDEGSVSQKTINSLKNLKADPTRLQTRPKTEAELAEEELERKSLANGFLTPTQYDYYVKILLLGDSGVGKTSLMLRFADNRFEENLIGTAGVDFKVKYVEEKGVKTKCQLWDTAGQEKFHVITKSYYRGAHGIALVFDVTDKRSFEKLGYWMENIKSEANEEVNLILLGNKTDKSDRVISVDAAKDLAEKHGYKYFDTSAKTAHNVSKAFETIARVIVADLKKKEEKHKAKSDSLTPLRAQQRDIIKSKNRCCVLS